MTPAMRVPEALVWLGLADCVLRLGGYHRLLRWLTRMKRRPHPSVPMPELAIEAHRTVSLAAGWYLPSAECLPQAVAKALMLRRRGVSSVVVLGVATVPFSGHAWLEVDGQVIGEDLCAITRYTELARIPVTP
jgi:hypothetical protein